MSKKTISHTEQLLNVHEAASYLGVNPGTVRRWAQSRVIQGLKVGMRGDWRFTKNYVASLARDASTMQQAEPQSYAPSGVDWESVGASGHFAQFYESDAFLIQSLKRHVINGLLKDDTCVLIISQQHRQALITGLSRQEAMMFNTAVRDGRCLVLDAQDTLSKLMKNDMPDRDLFDDVIDGVIIQALARKSPVRAFGEMVALLWDAGNESGAIELEELWNILQRRRSFSLVCAYPMKKFGKNMYCEPFAHIGAKHTGILPAESYTRLTDVTDRLRLITQLQQKAEALETEVEERKKLERQKDEFIGIASHELKTPVTSIKAYAQILQRRFERKGDGEAARFLRKMDTQLSRLTSLIHDLLDVTKIEAGELQFNQGYFDLGELVEEVIETMQLTTSTHEIAKDLAYAGRVHGDRDRIGQVITNLLGNAIKYSPNADKIHVTTVRTPHGPVLSVEDFGLGITKQDQTKIFDRFYRVDVDHKDTYPGMGLGLYIAAQIVKRHGGKLWVESEKGKGSIFSFSLPVSRSDLSSS